MLSLKDKRYDLTSQASVSLSSMYRDTVVSVTTEDRDPLNKFSPQLTFEIFLLRFCLI